MNQYDKLQYQIGILENLEDTRKELTERETHRSDEFSMYMLENKYCDRVGEESYQGFTYDPTIHTLESSYFSYDKRQPLLYISQSLDGKCGLFNGMRFTEEMYNEWRGNSNSVGLPYKDLYSKLVELDKVETQIKELKLAFSPQPKNLGQWLLNVGYVDTHNDLDFKFTFDEKNTYMHMASYVIDTDMNGTNMYLDLVLFKRKSRIVVRTIITKDILKRSPKNPTF